MGTYANTPFAHIDVEGLGKKGLHIYEEKYKDEFEKKYWGKFAEIDLNTGKAYIGDTDDEAWEISRKDAPNGFFFLIRIGSDSADTIL